MGGIRGTSAFKNKISLCIWDCQYQRLIEREGGYEGNSMPFLFFIFLQLHHTTGTCTFGNDMDSLMNSSKDMLSTKQFGDAKIVFLVFLFQNSYYTNTGIMNSGLH